ncbi:MDR family MFS transporter [Streptococcus jiangjianxini]|uniref:MDR family MFS transporter n=1 Tax=Streptococcus jiangjianxini TaxID=3161189 RepID=UPI0032EE8C76
MRKFFTLPKQLQWREELRFLSIILGSAIFPFMSMYYVHYFGAFITGLLVIVTQIVSFVATLYGGHLSDSLGRKKVTDLGNFGVFIGYVLTTFANLPGQVQPAVTFIGIFTVEVASNFAHPAYEAMLIDLTTEENRRFVYTINYWLINVAVMMGAGIAGAFYDHHFFELLLVMTLMAAFSYVIMCWKFEETRPKDFSFIHGRGVLATFRNYSEVAKDKVFMLYTLGTILFAAVWGQVDNYIPIHYKTFYQETDLFGITISGPKLLSLALFINTIMIVLLMTSINRLTEKMSLLTQIVLGGGIFATGIFAALTFKTLIPIMLAAVVYTLGEIIYIPASQVLRVNMMNENKIGSYSGFLAISQPLGIIIAGAMVSLSEFTGTLGVQLTFIIIASLGLYLMVHSAKLHHLS